jgi:hypothetical protein
MWAFMPSDQKISVKCLKFSKNDSHRESPETFC